MAERDRFELDLAAALRAYAEEAPIEARPVELARRFATAYPRGRGAARRWTFGLSPALAWTLLTAALLLALVVGGTLVAGARRPDRAVVVAPSPTPAPTATIAPDEGTDILATTKARPLPAQATCPPGSNPDAPGPADQQRPAHDGGVMAFDRHAGRVVLLADEFAIGPRTWTFDVCTNTWQRMNPPEEPASSTTLGPVRLVYDADSDRTLAFTSTGRVWSYDLAADTWTRKGWFPDTRNAWPLYHDPSGLVIVLGGPGYAYDVDTDTLTGVRQRPDPARPAGSGLPDGQYPAFGYDPGHDLIVAAVSRMNDALGETWTFDPRTGAWRLEASPVTANLLFACVWGCVPNRGAVFDQASGLTAIINPGSTRVEAYDAGQRVWRTLYLVTEDGPGDVGWCDSIPPVYDPLNARIVCCGGGSSGVSAFSTATGQWSWLLEPEATAAP